MAMVKIQDGVGQNLQWKTQNLRFQKRGFTPQWQRPLLIYTAYGINLITKYQEGTFTNYP